MTGNPEVLAALRFAIASEGHLNAQYRSDWRAFKFIGVKKLAKAIHGFGDDAHCWLKRVQDRTLLLGGDIGYVASPVLDAPGVQAAFLAELALEMAIVKPYEQAVQTCMAALDDTSRNLFEHLLKWHQKHVGWLEQQLRLIDALTETEYIAEQL